MALTSKRIAEEKQLYGLFLDLYYADKGYDSLVEEITDDLKHAKANSKKTKKSLEKVTKLYTDLNGGRKPSVPR